MTFKYQFKRRERLDKKLFMIILAVSLILILVPLFFKSENKVTSKFIESINEKEKCEKIYAIYCSTWKKFDYNENLRPMGSWKIFSRNYNCENFEDSKESCENFLNSSE